MLAHDENNQDFLEVNKEKSREYAENLTLLNHVKLGRGKLQNVETGVECVLDYYFARENTITGDEEGIDVYNIVAVSAQDDKAIVCRLPVEYVVDTLLRPVLPQVIAAVENDMTAAVEDETEFMIAHNGDMPIPVDDAEDLLAQIDDDSDLSEVQADQLAVLAVLDALQNGDDDSGEFAIDVELTEQGEAKLRGDTDPDPEPEN